MKPCIIFNPNAKGGKAHRFKRLLRDFAQEVTLIPTPAAGAARVLAAEAVGRGFDCIIAAGGDGTVNEVLNGIGDARDGFEKAQFAVLPLGTVNVFAMQIGLPLSPRRAWSSLHPGMEVRIDLGRVEATVNGQPEGRYFVQMAGGGLDARAVELVDWKHKQRVAQMAYVLAGLKALKMRMPTITARSLPLHSREGGDADSSVLTAQGELVVIGNGPYYGGKMNVFDGACNSDGLLDACVFRRVTWFTLLRYAWGYVTGTIYPPHDLVRIRFPELHLTSEERVPFEVDGELFGQLPARINVCPRKLRLLGPVHR